MLVPTVHIATHATTCAPIINFFAAAITRFITTLKDEFHLMVLVFVLSSTFVCHASSERDVSRGVHFVLGAFMVELLYVNANHVARTENAPNRPFFIITKR